MGSNLDPERNLVRAAKLLAERTELVAVSRAFKSRAVGAPQSPDFLNAAAKIHFVGSPQTLKFDVLRPIESDLGRVRTADRNAPRTIDIDIAIFGRLVIFDQGYGLELPAPEILTQAHVILPLADLAPGAIHPQTGDTLAEIAAQFQDIEDIEWVTDPVLTIGE
jgi:2-amino-4-hydroxy-6-hydroxymethyldihydropteridine diphosphokinase